MAIVRTGKVRSARRRAADTGDAAATLRQFAQTAQWAVLVVAGRRIAFASPRAEQMLGHAAGGLAGRALSAVVGPKDAGRLIRPASGGRAGSRGPACVETLALRNGGGRVWLEARASAFPWDGKPALLVLLADISPRKAVEDERSERERRYREMVHSSRQGLVVLRDGKVLLANRAAAKLFGFSGDMAAGTEFMRLVAPAEHARFWRTHKIGGAGRQPAGQEYEGRRVDGRPVWFRSLAQRVDWDGGPAVLAAISDTTAGRQAEAERRANERLLQTVFDAIPLRITVKDRAGKYLMANSAHMRAVGMSKKAIVGKSLDEMKWVPAWRRALHADLEAQVLSTRRAVELPEVSMDRPGRKLGTGRMAKVPILDDQGGVEGIITLWEDKSARLAIEQELRRGRRLLQTVFDAIPLGMTVKGMDGRYVMVNRAHSLNIGRPPEALIGHKGQERPGLPGGYVKRLVAADRAVVRSRASVELPEVRIRSADGIEHVRRIVKLPLLDERDRIEGILTLSEDVTARLAADEALRSSRRLLQTVFDIIPHYLFVRDTAGRFVMANAALAGFFGTTPGRLLGQELADVAGADSPALAAWQEEDRRVVEAGETLRTGDYRVRNRQGAEVWLHTLKLPLRDEAGRIVGVVGLGEDVTARRTAELALLENQSLLQDVLDAIPHSLFVKDREGRVVLVNRAYTRFWGTSATRPNLRHRDMPHIPREVVDAWEASDERVLRSGETVVSDAEEVTAPGGRRVWLRIIKAPRYDEQGRILGLVGLSEDVTARRTAELALQENQQMLIAAEAVGHIGSWTSSLMGTHALQWSPGVYRIFDMRPEEFDGRFESFTTRIHPADLEYFFQVRDRALKGEADYDFEHRIMRPDGTVRWVHERADVRRDAQGRPVQLIGVVQDITAQKDASLALRSQQRLIQAVFDTIPHEVFVKDRSSTYALVNHSFAAFYGFTPEQLKGLTTRDLPNVPADVLEAWIADDQRVMDTGQPVNRREFRYRTTDGREIWFDLRKFPWRDDENRVVGIVGVREDITERRHTEDLVRANRRLLRTVFDTIPHLLYVKDAHSRYIMVNEAMAQVYGRTPETMAGAHTLELPGALPEQRERLLAADRSVLDTGTPAIQPEVPIHEGERGTHWYNIVKLPLRNEEGRIIGIVGMSEDITARRRAEQELQSRRRLLRAVFDAVPFWLMVRDRTGVATLVNRRMAEDYGVHPDDFLGKTMQDDPHLSAQEKAALEAMDAEVVRTLRPVVRPELSVTLPGGRQRLLRMVAIPLFDEAGDREGLLALAEDITERKRSEQALLQAQKMESLGVLAGGIAHDFNNLLVAILGNASLALLKVKDGTAGHRELKQIEIAGQSAADLCRQMLVYAGKGPLEVQRIDVNQLVHEMTQLLRVSLPKGVAFTFRLTDSLPAVEGDPTQIRQVIMNLVINAGEAIGDKQGTITLATGVQQVDQAYLRRSHAAPDAGEGSYVFLEVADSGHGMDPQTLARIFDPFFTTKFTGRGLGLASVMGIVRGHRGVLRVYSEPGMGSAFRVLLPAAGSAAPTEAVAPSLDRWEAGGRVLLVDDEAEVLDVARNMLIQLGFTVMAASSGAEALEILRADAEPVRAALVDLTMPALSGEEVVQEMRRIRENLPVLVMSGYNEIDVRRRFLGRPNTAFLQKPFTLAALHARMCALLGDPARD